MEIKGLYLRVDIQEVGYQKRQRRCAMESLIHAIIDADKQAQTRLAQAQAKRIGVKKDAEGQKQAIIDRCQKDAKQKLAQHREELDAKLQAASQSKQADFDLALKRLHETFNTNKDSWIETIVTRCQES